MKTLVLGTVSCVLALAGCSAEETNPGGQAGTNVAGAAAGTVSGADGSQAGINGAAGTVAGVNGAAGTVAGTMGGAAGTVAGTMGGAAGTVAGTTAGTAGGPAPMCEVTCASQNDIRTGSSCENAASGVFAIKTVIDVWWQDDVTPPLVDSGRGFITVYLKGTLTDVCSDGSSGCGEMMGCGTILPPFASWANCNAYQITFPDEVWEQEAMPKFFTTGSVNMFEPGGLLTIAKATGLIGIALDDTEATWPTAVDSVSCAASVASGNVQDCFPDHDGDGRPGISIVMGNIGTNYRNTGCGLLSDLPVKFQGAPLDGLLGALCDPTTDATCRRATDLSIGLRTRLGGGGTIAACDASTAHGSGESDADYLDSRVIGCKLNNGAECTIDNVRFVDSSAPTYNILDAGQAPPANVRPSPCECPGGCAGPGCALDQTASRGSRSAVVRLGDVGGNFDCAAIRSAVDAQYPGTDF